MVGEGGGGAGGGGGWGIQDVTSLALFVYLSGLFISFYFHALNT